MKIFNRCCCCSLKAGAKIIGYYQTISGAIIFIFLTIVLVAFLSLPSDEIENSLQKLDNQLHIFNNTLNSTQIEIPQYHSSKAQRALVAFTLMFYMTYFFFYTALGVLLLYGIYKEMKNLINLWIKIKFVILLLSFIPVLFRLFMLLFGLDSDLSHDIYMGIWDIFLIAVIHSYHEEMEEGISVDPVAVV